jgi:Cof subfamily protein (haloacid dehalogenase superfamily)
MHNVAVGEFAMSRSMSVKPPPGRIELLVTDVDGTLCTPGTASVPEEVLEALREWVGSGRRLVFATGKRIESLEPLYAAVGAGGLAITCNGAMVYDTRSGNLLSSHFIRDMDYEDVVADIENQEWLAAAAYTATNIACLEGSITRSLLTAIGERRLITVSSLTEVSSEPIAKVLLASPDPCELAEFRRFFAARYASRLTVTFTSHTFVELMDLSVSKGKALEKMLSDLHISRNSVACIGDNDNDLSMMNVSGVKVAVANATPAVLSAADTVVPSAAAGGAAEAIRWILSGGTP